MLLAAVVIVPRATRCGLQTEKTSKSGAALGLRLFSVGVIFPRLSLCSLCEAQYDGITARRIIHMVKRVNTNDRNAMVSIVTVSDVLKIPLNLSR